MGAGSVTAGTSGGLAEMRGVSRVIAAVSMPRGLARKADEETRGVGKGVMLVLFISTSHSKYPGSPGSQQTDVYTISQMLVYSIGMPR